VKEPPEKQNSPSPSLNKTEPANENKKAQESDEDFLKRAINDDKNDDRNRNIKDLLQGLGVTSVYIDARNIDSRSGGNYFAGNVNNEGNITGRNYRKNTTKSEERSNKKEVAEQVLIEEIDKICGVYVSPPHYSRAKTILNEKHLLILRGEPHIGKWTTGIYLLATIGEEKISEIDPSTKNIYSFEYGENKKYIIDTLAVDTAKKIRVFALKELSQNLKNNQSYLVITIDISVKIPDQDLSKYIVDCTELPNNNLLLEKHILWYLKDLTLPPYIATLIKSESILELLKNKLLPYDVERLAELLTKVTNSELELEEALGHFGGRVKQQVVSWFEDHPDEAQRTFMIALAILNGASYQAVVDASQYLQSLIKIPSQKKNLPESETIFNNKRSQQLKDVGAHIVKGSEGNKYGQVDLILLDNPMFQPAILSYVWEEYYQLCEPLLMWLRDLGSHSSVEVRIRVAAAVGELSKYNFDIVLEKVLLSWATKEDQSIQILVAIALSVPIWEDNLAPQVLKFLNDWSTNINSNLYLRQTAILAYSGYVGQRFPDIALQNLLSIAKFRNDTLFLTLIQSIISIFEASSYLNSLNVLQAIHSWIEKAETTLTTQFGLLMFMILMNHSYEDMDSNYPTLVWLANKNQIYEGEIIYLLQQTLNSNITRTTILEQLHNWLKSINEQSQLYKTLGRIIYKLMAQGTDRERERISVYLKRWSDLDNSNTASKILAILKKYFTI